MDIVLSATGIVLLSPVLAAICLLIRFDSRGPAIFRQKRVGQGGRLFVCYKFRTMTHGADEALHREAVGRFWSGERLSGDPNAAYKLDHDPRLTRVGPWLRRASLDELPQLFNVLAGDMSLVGPRPAIPYELEFYEAWQHERHSVKPGLTGLWQVKGRGRVSADEMLRMDIEYARTWRPWGDLKLIVLTLPAILRAKGAR